MLTTAQLQALKAAILADQTLASLASQGAIGALKAALNEEASPAYVVWRTSVDIDEIMRNGLDWARVDNLSTGKARIWEWMVRLGNINPSKANIRAGIDATWVGTAADLAVRGTVYTHCKRNATRAEKLFASGAGTTVSPSVMTFEGQVSDVDIESALGA